ncbi:PKD domain-containing protein [Allomuricauda sp. NBRC 101325]|uniref:PKD domain-containing protein n=1 Tax=Allomuricauda sp. NBRC 101325 TaxID=1113758 RepID=UPI0025573BCC|nr:PKD domain-containing protein [Muricauda sp. NBRC 101325]
MRILIMGCFFIFASILVNPLKAQINFGQSNLDFNGFEGVSGVTSLMYGPDGRLYVLEYYWGGSTAGTIKIYTVKRNGPNNYIVTGLETLPDILDIVNHNDDGTVNTSVTQRETTGLTVAGTAENPIIYVTSSDYRIGAGYTGGDKNLDTNSGTITRLTWNGAAWEVVDLVRGLPRSEENHATNGLEFTTINGVEYLVVAQGGHTNAGSPSNNFTFICEYALSGAVLSINLDMLNAMPINTDGNGRNYIYDLPTMDDPTRANVNGVTDPNDPNYDGIDINDPFGGNDGLNMAVIVDGGPVQILSPGFRNPYDLVVTESKALYVTDNGANGDWGGLPVNEGGGSVTNAYDPTEPGSTTLINGEKVDNKDHLQLVTTNLDTYSFGSYYSGHPNPIRANPYGAGLFTAPETLGTNNAVYRTLTYDPDGSTAGSTSDISIALPANWPPVTVANSIEGDWRGPGTTNPDGPDDNNVTTWDVNTNGLDEYTASNFNGTMKGNLIAGDNKGTIKRVELNSNGLLASLTQPFQSGIGGDALGITCNGDSDNFPGTIWAGTLNGIIVVFEPQDYGTTCIPISSPEFDPTADNDNDGYTNQDEIDNGTDYCDVLSMPQDFDKSVGGTLVSDLNDDDDDADGIVDANDPFQLGNPATTGSDAFGIPVYNDFYNTQGLGGISNLGLTGLMNNGSSGPNWLDWLDKTDSGPNPNDVLDGNTGILVLQMTEGTALGSTNTQAKGYQYGVQVDQSSNKFTVAGKLIDLNSSLGIYGTNGVVGGELGYFIGDGSQSNYIKMVLTADGVTIMQEIDDVPQGEINIPIVLADRPNSDITFYFVIDPATGNIDFEYALDGGSRILASSLTTEGTILTALQNFNVDLAVGILGSSNTPGVELEGTWDYLNVMEEGEGYALRINAGGPQVVFDGKLFLADELYGNGTVFANTNALVDELYQTERYSSSVLNYIIPLENGEYTVILHFAEIYFGATGGSSTGGIGDRIFNVEIENSLVLDHYDIVADVGSETPVTKTFDITVEDGVLNLDFLVPQINGADNPKISAIEIIGKVLANQPPVAVANATPTSGNLPLEVSFIGSNSTDDTQVVGYTWDFKDGSAISTLANPTHTFTTEGTYLVELTVEDGEGLSDSTTITIEVIDPPNEAPIAIADANPVSGNLPLQVTFNGSNSSDDDAIVSYAWDFKDGSAISTEINPIHTFTIANTYPVELTVTDAEGLEDTATISIVVAPPTNDPPIAVASANPTNGEVPLPVLFNGSASTDDTGIIGYFWDFKDGTTSTDVNPVKTFDVPGSYHVELEVFDEGGLSAIATVTITVSTPLNDPPVAVANASVSIGTAPLTVNFTGTNSSDDKEIVSYLWNFNDGSQSSLLANPEHTFTIAGTYEVELTVTDEEGLTDTTSLFVLVNLEPNESPIAIISADPSRGKVPLVVKFDGSKSTDDKQVVGYLWDFKDSNATSTESVTTHTFTEIGTYEVTLTVFDAENLSDTKPITIVVVDGEVSDEIVGRIVVNPAKDIARIQIVDHSETTHNVVRIYVHDVSGKMMGLYDPAEIYRHGLYEIPIATFKEGSVYFVGFDLDNNQTLMLKLIVKN